MSALVSYRPQTIDGNLSFLLRDGVFKKICHDAAAEPEHNIYLADDEINRGDIPRIFSELLRILEKDKRRKQIVRSRWQYLRHMIPARNCCQMIS